MQTPRDRKELGCEGLREGEQDRPGEQGLLALGSTFREASGESEAGKDKIWCMLRIDPGLLGREWIQKQWAQGGGYAVVRGGGYEVGPRKGNWAGAEGAADSRGGGRSAAESEVTGLLPAGGKPEPKGRSQR